MIEINEFDPTFAVCLPETLRILESNGLKVHPAVSQITLHGSRGLARNPRPESDLDLSLLVSFSAPPAIDDGLGKYLREVLEVTSHTWSGPVELDLAAVFPLRDCNLVCFQKATYDPAMCPTGGIDCFGLYKRQRGFSGFVLNTGIQVRRMYPCITIWRKTSPAGSLPQMR
jgi:hypothetical protein